MNAQSNVPLRFVPDVSDQRPTLGAGDDEAWLARFHAGDRAILAACYERHFDDALRAIGTVLEGADRETVVHELFSRLLDRPELRRAFQGGSFVAWLNTLARNQAIDYRRRLRREVPVAEVHGAAATSPAVSSECASDARLIIEKFRREVLPPAWLPVFELCFLEQLPQRQAAARLGIHRTTLAYRELRIRRLLKKFLLGDNP